MSKIKKAIHILFTEGISGVKDVVYMQIDARRKRKKISKCSKEIHLISVEERVRQKQKEFSNPIKFSIITPLFNTPEKYLLELLDSLEKQTYCNWELCLADGSDAEHDYVGKICRKWSERDNRIVYSVLGKNTGISGNTNACIELASGEYVGLLDHDDILHESALFEMMETIEKTKADFLYSDEVKFSDKIENAIDFNFKSDFAKDELRSHNYICHFTVFSKKLLDGESVLYRSEFDGSQDHDMVLRLTEKANKVVHVPKVLYYWRVHPQSVSMNLNTKIYAVDAAIHAIEEQLEREKEPGRVECNFPYQTIYRIHYDVLEHPEVVILVHNCCDETEIKSVVQKIDEITHYDNYKIAIVNKEENRSWGELINKRIKELSGEYYILLDCKCRPIGENWIEEMLMFAQRNDVCAVSPKILYNNNTICFAGLALDPKAIDKIKFIGQGISDEEQGYEAMFRYVRNITSVWRGCCMFSADSWKLLGGFSEDLEGYEEVDFCLRGIQRKMWNVWTCFSRMEYEREYPSFLKNTESFSGQWEKEINLGDAYYHSCLERLELL